MTMKPRLDPFTTAAADLKPMLALSESVHKSGLEPSLIELVKIRASQINGCAYCIHMHTTEARKMGESEEAIYLLDAWRESPIYSDRERAALAWTEALTRVADTHAPDEDYARLDEHFSDEEKVKLTLLIGMINTWNRIAIGFRAVHPVETIERAAA